MAKEVRDLIVGLDIGTSKVAALVASLGADGALEILGMGSHASKGLKKGVVVNIEDTVTAIQRALEASQLRRSRGWLDEIRQLEGPRPSSLSRHAQRVVIGGVERRFGSVHRAGQAGPRQARCGSSPCSFGAVSVNPPSASSAVRIFSARSATSFAGTPTPM